MTSINEQNNGKKENKKALLANFTTVISIFAGVVVLGESFTWKQMIGTVLILASVYLAR